MNYFAIENDPSSGYTGDIEGSHKWGLPGILACPVCQATWGDNSRAYPSVDLTAVSQSAAFEEARAEPIEEYERLCELIRHQLPPGGVLTPGTSLGPLVGRAQGRFGPLTSPYPWWLLVQREALEKLQNEGLRGLKGCRTELRFRQRHPPDLLELELLPMGRLHPDCFPSAYALPCSRCGRLGLSLPKKRFLDVSSVQGPLDVFRLVDFSTVMVCTERFSDACQRLGLGGVTFTPLPGV
ncbi:double-CXXCG motif protein [Stigmatella sp. ncwal1]|uniref:Double-CXXCG motif protein n=1 Tax=Stigmatella ashevillensis TaxID=2995309 RepID=A0ABT5DBE2_9BACT|nr:double-CXXCG motif protein [Stigmatella ashevillena]MDC0710379.1 double-CXXCG motif protein [Stigmatella ashevillena]